MKENEKRRVRVAVRLRPVSQIDKNAVIVSVDGTKCVKVRNPKDRLETSFNFDYVFPPESTQLHVFEEIGLYSLNAALEGRNSTVIAYGQTGSGKTYTMLGDPDLAENHTGLIPRIIQAVYEKVNPLLLQTPRTTPPISTSFLEIYNEEIFDLLGTQSRPGSVSGTGSSSTPPPQKGLQLRQTPTGGILIDGLTTLPAATHEDLIQIISRGLQGRQVASTSLNSRSSRSHALFFVYISLPNGVRSKMALVDLAGSERVGSMGADKIRFKEGVNINRSLYALGNVIAALSEAHDPDSSTPTTTNSSNACTSPLTSMGTPTHIGNGTNQNNYNSHSMNGGLSPAGEGNSFGSYPHSPIPSRSPSVTSVASQEGVKEDAGMKKSSAATAATIRAIPFRQSKLTRLLQDSMGGNCSTCMIATIHPAGSNFWETMTTLNYAARASRIKTHTRRYSLSQATSAPTSPALSGSMDSALVRQLRDEVDRLRAIISAANFPSPISSDSLSLVLSSITPLTSNINSTPASPLVGILGSCMAPVSASTSACFSPLVTSPELRPDAAIPLDPEPILTAPATPPSSQNDRASSTALAPYQSPASTPQVEQRSRSHRRRESSSYTAEVYYEQRRLYVDREAALIHALQVVQIEKAALDREMQDRFEGAPPPGSPARRGETLLLIDSIPAASKRTFHSYHSLHQKEETTIARSSCSSRSQSSSPSHPSHNPDSDIDPNPDHENAAATATTSETSLGNPQDNTINTTSSSSLVPSEVATPSYVHINNSHPSHMSLPCSTNPTEDQAPPLPSSSSSSTSASVCTYPYPRSLCQCVAAVLGQPASSLGLSLGLGTTLDPENGDPNSTNAHTDTADPLASPSSLLATNTNLSSGGASNPKIHSSVHFIVPCSCASVHAHFLSDRRYSEGAKKMSGSGSGS
eukprot:TRINITY_DN4655_c0_g1::TRINITY_DN4655_c0_g1_i1::g.19514::m.19514 TRINITY_DN4655_c0_g1::TRINITY_DN4655_c0_g1_i1::g.19514  ORF type:complete len:921 (+),score=85.45,sp/P33174/KIF4_MOUSE/39.38/2e-44,sp/P33174/KIF4_MOUSE/63.46/6e-12,Kinesin/PF00225.18/7.2e-66,Kinesin/PF00225.18/3.7e-18 TRINITY_DN4655_c0_g1_i1:143-2905(+)